MATLPWKYKNNTTEHKPSSCRGRQLIMMVICCAMLSRNMIQVTGIFKKRQLAGRGGNVTGQTATPRPLAYTAVDGVCPPVPFETRADTHNTNAETYCLTTLTDELLTERWKGKARDFSTLLEKTRPLMEYYATRNGYTFVDQSSIVNATRPTSWFKIQAILNMFREHSCDWVLWVDADVLIMNYTIPLPALIPSDPEVEIILTPDQVRVVNAGVFLIHNSPWTQDFLNTWWNMDHFIVQEKSEFSGDNAALGTIVRDRWGWNITETEVRLQSNVLEAIEFSKNDTKIQLQPSMCTMNSWLRFGTEQKQQTRDQWFNNLLHYRKGDFICHLAGIHEKDNATESILREYYY